MTTKIAVIILCRYNSTRLPGKILKEISGQTVLSLILQRVKQVFAIENILVATSSHSSDQPIVDYCKGNGYPVFTGDLENVASRFLNAAKSMNATYAIRINGDNLFVDIPLLKEFKCVLEQSSYDFISNVKDRTYPKGMSIEAVKVDYYQWCFDQFTTPAHFEHVTSFLYEHPPKNAHYFYNHQLPEAAGIQLALDTPSDFEMAKQIFLQMKEDQTHYHLEDIYKFYKNTNDESF
jgi:spore coat polysaccharide biosynthesis protein SpsF